MKRVLFIPIFVAILILSGFIIPLFLTPKEMGCTLMGCPCEGIEGERTCNICGVYKPVFTLGVFNVVKSCHSKEIIVCKNNQQFDQRFEIEDCKYNLLFFKIKPNNYSSGVEDADIQINTE